MNTDVEISKNANIINIRDIANKLNLSEEHIERYGNYVAKLNIDKININKENNSKLILVSSINPTKSGEGKTTTMIGLGQLLNNRNIKTIVAMREPSLGVSLGMKGGATGGGYAQVVPMEDINLHFTGDMYAIATANNLISACVDNHIFNNNKLKIKTKTWKRCIDICDRELREKFDITPASEIMAILCLAEDISDLRKRLEKIIVGYNEDDQPVYLKELGIVGSVIVLLKDAIKPNLVQDLENNPVLVHGGPFANIAHGCNSVIATKLALNLADIVLTEAGFGSDLGAEKFFNIKCMQSKLKPDACLIVCTIDALRQHSREDNLEEGFLNLKRHIENVKDVHGVPCMVVINKMSHNSEQEYDTVKLMCECLGVPCACSDVWEYGSRGSYEMVDKLLSLLNTNNSNFKYLYKVEDDIEDKISSIVRNVYKGKGISLSEKALNNINRLKKLGLDKLPICIAKTQYSFTSNPIVYGAPEDFILPIEDVLINNGAGFIVVIVGKIIRMPGLPKKPKAMNIDLDINHQVIGLD